VRAAPRSWRPAPSLGVPLGLGIAATALACLVALVVTGVVTSSVPTRVACIIGAVVGIATLLLAVVGTWWCSTLRYVLGPAAIDVRFGSQVLRLRYNEIEGIVAGSNDSSVPTLWPGAHFGRSTRTSGELEVWRATTRDPRHAVVVSAGGSGHVLTPMELTTFRAELIENAQSAAYAVSRDAARGRIWLDAVVAIDGWVRALLFGAGVVAAVGITTDVARFGASQADGISAATILLVNAAGALAISVRWPIIARLLAAGALAGQVIALV